MTGSSRPAAYRHVAVCVDGSEAGELALAEARAIRALAPGRLSIVHVAAWPAGAGDALAAGLLDPEELLAPEQRWLEDLAAGVPEGEPVFLTAPFPAGAACDWARAAAVDLLVAAPHSGLLTRALMGSFAGHLVRHAPCSVLLARPRSGQPHSSSPASRG